MATAFEQAYGWQLTREDGTWYQLGDAVPRRERKQAYVAAVLAGVGEWAAADVVGHGELQALRGADARKGVPPGARKGVL